MESTNGSAALEPRAAAHVLVCVARVDGDLLDRLIETATRQAADAGLVPVFVTDQLATAAFLRRGVRVEVVPVPTGPPAPAHDAYVASCLRRIRRRWAPVAVLDIGRATPDSWRALLRHG